MQDTSFLVQVWHDAECRREKNERTDAKTPAKSIVSADVALKICPLSERAESQEEQSSILHHVYEEARLLAACAGAHGERCLPELA